MSSHLIAIALVASLSSSAAAQSCGVWTNSETPGPTRRSYSAAAFDSVRSRLVVFGGNNGVRLGDTWEWNGNSWNQRVVSGPAARNSHAMTFDPVRGRVVLFGGFNDSSLFLADTWEWDGASWVLVATSGPSGRAARLAFDPAALRVILFGGGSGLDGGGGVFHGDTWSWDGVAWSRIATDGPSPRAPGALFGDASRGGVILHGGESQAGSLRDTWLLQGSQWTQLQSDGPPGCASGAYDATSGTSMLFDAGTTWLLDGTTWRAVQGPAPASRCTHDLTPAPAIGGILMFGAEPGTGQSEPVWLLRGGGPILRCGAPVIEQDLDETATLSTLTVGPTTSARWFRNDGPVLNGGRVSGAATTTLSIHSVEPGDAGVYRLHVSGPLCDVIGDPIELRVICPADFDRSGSVNPDDLSDFITCFFIEVQLPGGCPAADLNQDGFVNPDDLSDFITSFFTTC